MTAKLYNNVTDSLASVVVGSGTVITVSDGSKFPDPSGGDYIPLYIIRATDEAHEIVHITGVSGNDLTVVRSREGTDPLTFNAGDSVQIRPTRQSLLELNASNMTATTCTSTGEQTLAEALNNRIIHVNNIAELQAISPTLVSEYQHVYVKEYYDGTGYGGGLYVNAGSNYSGSDAIEGAGGTQWRMVVNNNVFPIDRLGAVKDDPESVKDAFILAIECVREAGSGTVYVGPGEWTMASFNYEVNVSNITFHFDLGCHFKMEDVILGWYPTATGKGYHNVSIVGEGTIEALPETMWHNDLVYVTGIQLKGLTFIRPVLMGHFLDLMGCTDVCIENITVLGSNVERPGGDSRLFSEFIQVGDDGNDGLGWPAKRTVYEPLMNQGIGTTNTTLTNSVFMPYTDADSVTTYPPRPIGNHVTLSEVRDLRIVGNEFKDVIRPYNYARNAWLEIPTVDGVHISGNSFVCTSAAFIDPDAEEAMATISLRGSESSRGVAINDNTFDITRPDGTYVICVTSKTSGADISVTGNVFKVAAEFSDIIELFYPGNLRLLGNSVDSTGRRFLFSPEQGAGSKCLVQGNDIVFNTLPTTPHRDPVDLMGASLIIVGNHIEHPTLAFGAYTGSVCTAAGNTMVGGATAVDISNGVLTGNVFNTTTAPTVTIDGSVQTSKGWDFVHVPWT